MASCSMFSSLEHTISADFLAHRQQQRLRIQHNDLAFSNPTGAPPSKRRKRMSTAGNPDDEPAPPPKPAVEKTTALIDPAHRLALLPYPTHPDLAVQPISHAPTHIVQALIKTGASSTHANKGPFYDVDALTHRQRVKLANSEWAEAGYGNISYYEAGEDETDAAALAKRRDDEAKEERWAWETEKAWVDKIRAKSIKDATAKITGLGF